MHSVRLNVIFLLFGVACASPTPPEAGSGTDIFARDDEAAPVFPRESKSTVEARATPADDASQISDLLQQLQSSDGGSPQKRAVDVANHTYSVDVDSSFAYGGSVTLQFYDINWCGSDQLVKTSIPNSDGSLKGLAQFNFDQYLQWALNNTAEMMRDSLLWDYQVLVSTVTGNATMHWSELICGEDDQIRQGRTLNTAADNGRALLDAASSSQESAGKITMKVGRVLGAFAVGFIIVDTINTNLTTTAQALRTGGQLGLIQILLIVLDKLQSKGILTKVDYVIFKVIESAIVPVISAGWNGVCVGAGLLRDLTSLLSQTLDDSIGRTDQDQADIELQEIRVVC